jgi:ribosomal protein S18 acetylase RimI-like enzyme
VFIKEKDKNKKSRVSNVHYNIRKLSQTQDLPFGLLLLADETIKAIEKYIYDSDVYVAVEKKHSQPIAVFALYKRSDTDIEIKNIAVSEQLQNAGIGGFLISEIKRIAIAAKYENIIVGTPDSAARQINFYEKNGFRKYDLRKDFFVQNYPAPIIENGIMLKNMAMLKMEL